MALLFTRGTTLLNAARTSPRALVVFLVETEIESAVGHA
jgi:hypothetical protein